MLGWTEERQVGVKYEIDPETEFWGHCSNLQSWYKHDYDTRLLHSNLSFPLLKRLTKVGDPLANKVFKEEIAKRLASGYGTVIDYLTEEGYLDDESEFVSVSGTKVRVKNGVLNLSNFSFIKGIFDIKGLESLNNL